MSTLSSTPTLKNVFIVGAGASKEVDLPIGSDLKKSIAKALDIQVKHGGYHLLAGDHDIFHALRLTAEQNPTQRDLLRSLQSACWKIRDAMPQASSIDNFLDVHSDDKHIELCGKLAIVHTILEAEAKSKLFVDPIQPKQRINFEGVENTWFNRFFQRLFENCKPEDIPKRLSSVVLIIFNYDRCVEHYLYYALQNYYSISDSVAGALLRQHLEIYHPYGTVGSLPWINQDGSAYGATPSPPHLLKLSSQIKTFTEGTDEQSSDVIDIRTHMRTSSRLVFLGFAFHDLNLNLLSPKGRDISPQHGRSVLATAVNISDSDVAGIRDELGDRRILSTGHIEIRNDLTCSDLFKTYSCKLTFI